MRLWLARVLGFGLCVLALVVAFSVHIVAGFLLLIVLCWLVWELWHGGDGWHG